MSGRRNAPLSNDSDDDAGEGPSSPRTPFKKITTARTLEDLQTPTGKRPERTQTLVGTEHSAPAALTKPSRRGSWRARLSSLNPFGRGDTFGGNSHTPRSATTDGGGQWWSRPAARAPPPIIPPEVPAVWVRGLVHGYGKNPVLKGVNLTVPQNQIYGLLGPSGTGKTSLLKILLGRMAASGDGQVEVYGCAPGDLHQHPAYRVPGRAVGYMPQEPALYEELTIGNTLRFHGSLHGMSPSAIRKRIEWLAEFLDLPDLKRRVGALSGGQQRRLSLAVAMLHNPDLLVLDEPTVGVDPLLRIRIWEHLRELVRLGTTVIITTHYIEEATAADTVGLMRAGRLLAEDSPQALIKAAGLSSLEDTFLALCAADEAAHTFKPANPHGTLGKKGGKGGPLSWINRSSKADGDAGVPLLSETNDVPGGPSSPRGTPKPAKGLESIAAKMDTYAPDPKTGLYEKEYRPYISSYEPSGSERIGLIRPWAVWALGARKITSLFKAPKTLAAVVVAPALMIILVGVVIGNDPHGLPLGVVNNDRGFFVGSQGVPSFAPPLSLQLPNGSVRSLGAHGGQDLQRTHHPASDPGGSSPECDFDPSDWRPDYTASPDTAEYKDLASVLVMREEYADTAMAHSLSHLQSRSDSGRGVPVEQDLPMSSEEADVLGLWGSETFGSLLLSRMASEYGDAVILKEFKTQEEANAAATKGQTWGTMSLSPTFSENAYWRYIKCNSSSTPGDDSGVVRLRMDMTSQQIAFTIIRDLSEAMHLATGDYIGARAIRPVNVVSPPVFGQSNPLFLNFIAPGFMVVTVFSFSLSLTAVVFVVEKTSATLDRVYVTGAGPIEILMGHQLAYSILLTFQTILMLVVSFTVLKLYLVGNPVTLFLIAILLGLGAMGLGLVVSSGANTVFEAMQPTMSIMLFGMLSSGIIWPIQAAPNWLQTVALVSPMLWAVDAFRSVLARGWGPFHPGIAIPLAVLLAQLVVYMAFSAYVLRIEKKKAPLYKRIGSGIVSLGYLLCCCFVTDPAVKASRERQARVAAGNRAPGKMRRR